MNRFGPQMRLVKLFSSKCGDGCPSKRKGGCLTKWVMF